MNAYHTYETHQHRCCICCRQWSVDSAHGCYSHTTQFHYYMYISICLCVCVLSFCVELFSKRELYVLVCGKCKLLPFSGSVLWLLLLLPYLLYWLTVYFLCFARLNVFIIVYNMYSFSFSLEQHDGMPCHSVWYVFVYI